MTVEAAVLTTTGKEMVKDVIISKIQALVSRNKEENYAAVNVFDGTETTLSS